jgi:hypothetical protein
MSPSGLGRVKTPAPAAGDPCAPPCIRQRLLPVTAGDRHGVPDRVCRLDRVGAVGEQAAVDRVIAEGVSHPLSAGMDMDMADLNGLL